MARMVPFARGQIQQRHSKVLISMAVYGLRSRGKYCKSDVEGEAQLWLCDGNEGQLKVLDFLHWFHWKCGDHKQAGITEIMWPGGGNPQTAVSVIFLHLPSHPGYRQRPICFKSSTSKKKKKKSPAQKRQGCLPLPGAMISVLMKTSEGLILSHTHRHSFHSGLIARESDALRCTGDAEFVWMIVTALISFISKISRSN